MEQKDFLSFGGLQKWGVIFIKMLIIKRSNQYFGHVTALFLQNLSCDPVLLPTVEGFGVEHNVGAVA